MWVDPDNDPREGGPPPVDERTTLLEYLRGYRLGHKRDGTAIPLRAVLVHMIEEYARHCGHADLRRERVDGRVGQ